MILDYANDNTPEALAAAAHNFALLVDKWHDPKSCKANIDDYEGRFIAYFRDPNTGNHGWMCTQCRHVVQTG